MTQNIGIRNGLLGGLAVIAYFTVLYVARKELFLNPALQWGSLVIYLLFMYRAARQDGAVHAGMPAIFGSGYACRSWFLS